MNIPTHAILRRAPIWALPAWFIIVLAGCQSAVFVATETKSGLSVSATNGAPSASLGYHRGELAVIPQNNQGTTNAVFGGLDHDYSLGGDGFAITQTFATGQAAINASHGTTGGKSGAAQNGTLYFATGTTFGLTLTSNDATSQSPSLLMGFRRAEGVYIPTNPNQGETNSVYADVSIVYWPKDTALAADDAALKKTGQDPAALPARKNAVRIRQKFATGDAAIQFVANNEIATKLQSAAGNADYTTTIDEKKRVAALQTRLQAITDPARQADIVREVQAIPGIRARIRPADYADLRDKRVLLFKDAELTQLEAIINRNNP